jgi:hypothetical protein
VQVVPVGQVVTPDVQVEVQTRSVAELPICTLQASASPVGPEAQVAEVLVQLSRQAPSPVEGSVTHVYPDSQFACVVQDP